MTLGAAKRAVLNSARRLEIQSLFLNSQWRQSRLAILCYHGVSLEDEHLWKPDLFVPREFLLRRFEWLRNHGCAVLPLDEAITRLENNNLPPKAVVLTFDDGGADFHSVVTPMLREFGFPATLYYTTYYGQYNRPVFDVMCSYLLWKTRGNKFTFPGIITGEVHLDGAGVALAANRIKEHAFSAGLSGVEKDRLLSCIADRLGIDYEAICAKRILHLITPSEAREVTADGSVSIQLHTHRHRVSRNRTTFQREILRNRQCIAAITDAATRHFCYPGGAYLPEHYDWLREFGVRSATTCDAGIAYRGCNPYLLPRYVDHCNIGATEFFSWISGFASLLPQRKLPFASHQILEDVELKAGEALVAKLAGHCSQYAS